MNTRHRDGQPVSIVQAHGLTIHIDRHVGTVLSGTGPDGKPYEVVQQDDYGFLPGVMGDDGEEWDCYLGKEVNCDRVFVVTQLKASNDEHIKGLYDEQKGMIGYKSRKAAEAAYRAHTHPSMFGGMGEMPINRFHAQLKAHRESGAQVFRAVADDVRTITERAMFVSPTPSPADLRATAAEKLCLLVCNGTVLSLVARDAHWNVKGPCFGPLHDLFGEVYSAVSELVDTLAERVVTLGGSPSGLAVVGSKPSLSAATLTSQDGLALCAMLSGLLNAYVAMVNETYAAVEEMRLTADANVLQDAVQTLEKLGWKLAAHVS